MIILNCVECGQEFGTSACNARIFCDNCSGVTEAKNKEIQRWKNLILEERIEELKTRIEALEQKQTWDGL